MICKDRVLLLWGKYKFLAIKKEKYMGIFGSALGGALGVGASIFGGVQASKAMSKVKKNLEGQMKENQNWYDRNYNTDSTQRADAQHMISMMNENIRQRNSEAAGAAAVGGATEESLAATKAANAQSMGDAMTKIAIAGDRRKDNIEQQYMQTKSSLNSQLNNMEKERAQAIANAAQGVADAGAGLGDLF